MAKSNKTSTIFKSYSLGHKANPGKVDLLFDLYSVYKSEYKFHMKNYWNLFLNNKISNNKFSHIGSTKHIRTQLNASYIQCLLSQACASLNNYIANINTKFSEIVSKSSIKDKDLLHKLRTINSKHAWLNSEIYYYPNRLIIDDYGNEIESKLKLETLIDKSTLRLARQIFNHIVDKDRVRFPNVNKPRLLIDDRLYSLEESKTNSFDYWLKVTGLQKGKRITIPIRKNDYFNRANGELGKTIELDFINYDYEAIQHKHNSLSKKQNKFNKVDKQVKFIFNKKLDLEKYFKNKEFINTEKDKVVSFDLGLCNFIATSDGELYGQYWFEKLTQYDRKIQELSSSRQRLGLKTRSKRYDNLINQVRGFIKTETNRILNKYIENNPKVKTVVIERLRFSSPELSRRLNRIIQNFGYKLFKDKLEELSLFYGFSIEELNPAYTSQECVDCGYVDKNNRATQSVFKCKCCSKELNADIQGGRVNLKRFQSKQNSIYKSLSKGTILRKLKLDFSNKIQSLTSNGKVSRRNLYKLLLNNSYFNSDLKEIVRTTEAQGLESMTVLNFDKYLKDFYQTKDKIKSFA